ncbi:MAG: apolipoprotein N-acyltransferase, partial [Deltaproteobacteria bacterium]|nr:apolipoprotein N-acyltransferase [Deltaproteobacteria bacterium]
FIRRDDHHADFFNSAFLIDPNGNVAGKYDKVHLVPFGEYVPFQEWFPFIGKIVEEVGDFKSGRKGQTLIWGEFPLGIQICYEMIFPDLSREMARNQAAFLINMTNDAWYGKTSAPYQHFSMAVFRAVENRRSLIRSANTGISGFIDPAGRIIASTPLYEEAVITRSLPVLTTESFYTRYGDVFALTCMAISILLFFLCAITQNRIRGRTALADNRNKP